MHAAVRPNYLVIGAAKSGRTPDRGQWRMVREVFVADTDEKARAYVTAPNSPYRLYYTNLLTKLKMAGRAEAFKESRDTPDDAVTVESVLEKLVLWRHCHFEACEGHEGHAHGHQDHGRSGLLILVGDTFHNFVDGVLIAAAFMEDVRLGFVTALAMIAHEIPQEVGDFLILLHSGYSKARALAFNLLSSLATLVGGLLAYAALSAVQGAVPVLLALAAASMIYVAVADLIPGLHKRTELRATIQQIVLILLGVATIVAAHRLADRLAA